MKGNKKIKVVWICHFSNEEVRKNLRFSKFYLVNLIRKIAGSPLAGCEDCGIWNANAVKEIVKYDDIELSVIMPFYGIRGNLQQFDLRGVHFYCYRSENDHLLPFLKEKILHKYEKNFQKNRRLIKKIISEIHPDIVHIMGAENPYYSIAALDVPSEIPSIVSLQTLLSDPDFKNKYPFSPDVFDFRANLECRIIQKSQYIATDISAFTNRILKDIKPHAKFLQIALAGGTEIDTTLYDKEFDFVYFAANVEKACDDAIEAFGLLCKRYPDITLNVSGAYDANFKKKLDNRIRALNIVGNVIFTGSQKTHTDVLRQIKKSRFALLPLKVDVVSGTIREAMACGLPVVTTITEGTPALNKERQSVLLSEQGDYVAMAGNMQKLLEDDEFADFIKNNAFETVRERWSNQRIISFWHDAYIKILQDEVK